MTAHDDGRAAQAAANLARHLNGQHPGTVLLLARHATGGRPDATAGSLLGADGDRLVVAATVPDGQVELRLALPDGPDLRARIGALLAQTRAGLPADGSVPLTSLEQQMSGRHR